MTCGRHGVQPQICLSAGCALPTVVFVQAGKSSICYTESVLLQLKCEATACAHLMMGLLCILAVMGSFKDKL